MSTRFDATIIRQQILALLETLAGCEATGEASGRGRPLAMRPPEAATAFAAASAGGLALTEAQRRICIRVINIFETGTVAGDYGAISIYHDGPSNIQQVTYGRAQTTEFGNLRELISDYVAANGRFSSALARYVQIIGTKVGNPPLSPLVNDQTFLTLLRNAGGDPVMIQTQDAFFDRVYFQPALDWASGNGFVKALSALVIYDSFNHSGGILSSLRAAFPERTPADGGDEKTWISQYVAARQNWLATNPRAALRTTVYRTKDLMREINRDNWELSIVPIFANGVPVDGAPDSRSLGAQALVAPGAAIAEDDPAAPAPAEVSETAGFEWGRVLANLGAPTTSEPPLLSAAPEAAAAGVSFDLVRVKAFLQACETSIPRVSYGLGKKVPSLDAVPGRDFTQVDCSGFVREAIRLATTPTLAFPDGSVVQHDWVNGRGFERSTVAEASNDDGVVRIAFLSPQDSPQGIGHVVLISGGKTFESHGGVGPDSRTWDGGSWQAKTSVYVFARSGQLALPVPAAETLEAAQYFAVKHGHRYAATVVLNGFEQFASNDQVARRFIQLGFIDVDVTGSGSTRHGEATWNGVDTTASMDSHLRDVVEIPATPAVAAQLAFGVRPVYATASAGSDRDKLASVMDTVKAAGYAQILVKISKGSPMLAGPAGAAAMELAAAVAPASSLESYFIIPHQAQLDVLEAAAVAPVGTAARSAARAAYPGAPKVRIFPHLGFALGYADADGLEGLAARAEVERLMIAPELSLIRPVAQAAAGKPTASTWGIQKLKADQLWVAGITGKGVIVGHLDTGVDGAHPALVDAIDDFVEFDLQGNRVAGALAHDSGEHGTHTAGTILGRATGKGAFGMAPDAKLASALVIEGGNVVARILGGMEWIIEKRVRILSMSLGLRGYTPAFQAIVDALRANNVLPIFAAGNEGVNTSRSPGNYGNVLSVGAMASDDTVPGFSSSEQFNRPDNQLIPDLVAPGVGVLSCIPGGGYAQMDGTSMATPHVVGLAALLLQAKPNASADDLENAIQDSCVLPSTMTKDRANRGVPDGVAAFQKITGGPLPQPQAALVHPRHLKKRSVPA